MTETIAINTAKCMARTGAKLQQCTRKKKNGDYCGIHNNKPNIIRIDESLSEKKQKKFNKYLNTINNLNSIPAYKTLQQLDYYIRNSKKIIKLQSVYRSYLIRKFNKMRGPALKNRSLCNNHEDMYTLDSITEIHPNDFYSFVDKDGFVYGFHILSIFKYLETCSSNIKTNPYNKNELSITQVNNINSLYKFSVRYGLNNPIKNEYSNDPKFLMRSRLVNIFQKMDSLNNYTDISWFLDLNILELKHLYDLIKDLWLYRMELTDKKRSDIVLDGKLFTCNYNFNTMSLVQVQNTLLDIMGKLVNDGKTKEDQYLGSLIILSGLVDIHIKCAESYPWLVQSTFE